MKLSILFPAFPPALDGIGDYTARLAVTLADRCDVTVITAQQDAEPVPGVQLRLVPPLDTPAGRSAVEKVVVADAPDWLLIQFNQFSYGRWGLNPLFPLAIRRLRRRCPALRIAVMFHEDFVPITSWKFAAMTTWQRWQFWMLGRQADHVFFSIEPWAERYRSWFPHAPVTALPVGSNIPNQKVSYNDARVALGIAPDQFVAGVFGTAGPSRLLSLIRAATDALAARVPSLLVLYVGPHGSAIRDALGPIPMRDAGALPAPDVSRHLAAMDVHLTPFDDGVSSRRGSCLAGLQHGVATLTTEGVHTEEVFLDARDTALCMTPVDAPDAFARIAVDLWEHPDRRHEIGRQGRLLYESHCDWPVVAEQFLTELVGTVGSVSKDPSVDARTASLHKI